MTLALPDRARSRRTPRRARWPATSKLPGLAKPRGRRAAWSPPGHRSPDAQLRRHAAHRRAGRGRRRAGASLRRRRSAHEQDDRPRSCQVSDVRDLRPRASSRSGSASAPTSPAADAAGPSTASRRRGRAEPPAPRPRPAPGRGAAGPRRPTARTAPTTGERSLPAADPARQLRRRARAAVDHPDRRPRVHRARSPPGAGLCDRSRQSRRRAAPFPGPSNARDPLRERRDARARAASSSTVGLADAAQAAEVPQQRAAPPGPDARDGVERRAQARPAAQLAVVGDGEAVRLVAHALQQEERGRVARAGPPGSCGPAGRRAPSLRAISRGARRRARRASWRGRRRRPRSIAELAQHRRRATLSWPLPPSTTSRSGSSPSRLARAKRRRSTSSSTRSRRCPRPCGCGSGGSRPCPARPRRRSPSTPTVIAALDGRDVEALDALRRRCAGAAGAAAPPTCARPCARRRGARAKLCSRVLRAPSRRRRSLSPRCGRRISTCRPRALAQVLGAHRGVLELDRQQDLVGHVALVAW